MATPSILAELPKHTREAVRIYWETRSNQLQKQRDIGGSDQGSRGAVTGGAQMDGFIALLTRLVIEAGIDPANIYNKDSLELPGYFRPSKRWDFLVVVKSQLIAALKMQVQRDPFSEDNQQSQEAICDALDVWTAYRKSPSAWPRPWVGLLMLVEEPAPPSEALGEKSQAVKCSEAFCRRLILERFYDSAALVVSNPEAGHRRTCSELGDGIGFDGLATSLFTAAAELSGRITALPPRLRIAC